MNDSDGTPHACPISLGIDCVPGIQLTCANALPSGDRSTVPTTSRNQLNRGSPCPNAPAAAVNHSA
jgi:hypothetical protein